MEDNRIFSEIGKKTPYQVPKGYFEQSKERLQAIPKASAPRNHRPRPNQRLIRWSYAAVASLALLLGIVALLRLTLSSAYTPSSDPTDALTADQTYALITDAPLYSSNDAEDWDDFADADIFLDNL